MNDKLIAVDGVWVTAIAMAKCQTCGIEYERHPLREIHYEDGRVLFMHACPVKERKDDATNL